MLKKIPMNQLKRFIICMLFFTNFNVAKAQIFFKTHPGINPYQFEITKEKFAAIKRWSTRNYQEREKSTEIICNYERKFCSVRGVVDWTVSSQTRNARSSGASEFELGLDYASGRLKIVQENGRTLNRAN